MKATVIVCDYKHNGTPCSVQGPHEYHQCGGTRIGPAEPNSFEPPTVTPIGNMHDLLAQVCGGDHEK